MTDLIPVVQFFSFCVMLGSFITGVVLVYLIGNQQVEIDKIYHKGVVTSLFLDAISCIVWIGTLVYPYIF